MSEKKKTIELTKDEVLGVLALFFVARVSFDEKGDQGSIVASQSISDKFMFFMKEFYDDDPGELLQ